MKPEDLNARVDDSGTISQRVEHVLDERDVDSFRRSLAIDIGATIEVAGEQAFGDG
jgi:hypothetical protein